MDKTKIESNTIDYMIEIIGLIGLICLIVLPIYFFNDLPDRLPKHFNALGQPDSYGSKGIIWLLPTVGLFLYVGLTFLSKIPFTFNYPTKLTKENKEKVNKIGTRAIQLLKVAIIYSFVFLSFKTIKIGLNKSTELGGLFLPIFLSTILIILGVMIYKMRKK